MRGGVLSVNQDSMFGRSLVLALGLCPLALGCGDKSTADKAAEVAPPARTGVAPAGIFPTDQTPTLTAVPENRNSVGDRYADAPRYPAVTGSYPPPQTIVDPAVQPAGYVTSNAPLGLRRVPSEKEFIPNAEELQLFEQKNDGSPQPPKGWFGSEYTPNFSIEGVRANPLPLSP